MASTLSHAGTPRRPNRSGWAMVLLVVLGGGLAAAGMLSVLGAIAMVALVSGVSSFLLAWQARGAHAELGAAPVLEHVLEGVGSILLGLLLAAPEMLAEPVGWCVSSLAIGCSLWSLALTRRRVVALRAAYTSRPEVP